MQRDLEHLQALRSGRIAHLPKMVSCRRCGSSSAMLAIKLGLKCWANGVLPWQATSSTSSCLQPGIQGNATSDQCDRTSQSAQHVSPAV